MKGNVRVHFYGDGAKIEVFDTESKVKFAEIAVKADNLSDFLGCAPSVPCEFLINECPAKEPEYGVTDLTFAIPFSTGEDINYNVVRQIAKVLCPDGWEPDLSFDSILSVYEENGIMYASTTRKRVSTGLTHRK